MAASVALPSSCLLRAPPALRSEVARRLFSTSPQASSSSFSSVSLPFYRSRNFFATGNGGLICASSAAARRGCCTSFRGLVVPPLPATSTLRVSAGIRLQSTTASSSTSTSSSSSSTNETTSSSSSSTPPPYQHQPRQRSRTARFLLTTTLFLLSATAAFAMSAAPAAETLNGWANPPTDAESLTLYEPTDASAETLNARLTTLPLVETLRKDASLTEARPHMKIPPAMRSHNLTAGVLMGPEKLEIPPLYFTEKSAELPTMTQIAYLGPALCGHPGIVHGGLLATLLDEGLARCCFPALPNKVGVTANLKIDYRVPCQAGRFVVLKAFTTKVEGRKAWVHGWIEGLSEDGTGGDGVKIVEAEALFIEPKQAKAMARVYSTQ